MGSWQNSMDLFKLEQYVIELNFTNNIAPFLGGMVLWGCIDECFYYYVDPCIKLGD